MAEEKTVVEIADPITIRLDKMPEIVKKKRAKILWYSDFLISTGFGNVAEELLSRLHKTGKYEFVVLGINYKGVPYNQPSSEYYHLKDIPVWPAVSHGPESNLFGYDVLASMLANQHFDLFFALQDSFNLIPMKTAIKNARLRKDLNFKYCLYFPVDGDINKSWVDDAIKLADKAVTYTEYGQNVVAKHDAFLNVEAIPHGIDLEKFKPFEDFEDRAQFRQAYFNITSDTFLISNINRNQPRKDLPRTIIAFREFCKKYPKVKTKLYLHCRALDGAGHKIHEFTKAYLPEELWDRVILPSDESMGGNGVDTETLSKVYAASDVVTSTTFGEGWGLSTVEAMACKTPVVMPDNSATTEILGKNSERGYLVKSGQEPSAYVTMKFDNELLRPVTDIGDLVAKWKMVLDSPEEAKQKAEAAYAWLQDYTWDKIAKRWEVVLDDMLAK